MDNRLGRLLCGRLLNAVHNFGVRDWISRGTVSKSKFIPLVDNCENCEKCPVDPCRGNPCGKWGACERTGDAVGDYKCRCDDGAS